MYNENSQSITNIPDHNIISDSNKSQIILHNPGNKSICIQHVCEKCNYITVRKSSYDSHLLSKKHQDKGLEKNNTYSCEICNYKTNTKRNYNTHLSSKKHEKSYSSILSSSKKIYSCEICDYTTIVKCNYSKHVLSKSHVNKTQQPIKNEISIKKDTIISELKNMILEQYTKINEQQSKLREEEYAKMLQMIDEIGNKQNK
jgi:hypothetical protein